MRGKDKHCEKHFWAGCIDKDFNKYCANCGAKIGHYEEEHIQVDPKLAISELLSPPNGYSSWLSYAVSTMETRQLFNDQISSKEHWPDREIVQREEMREAALNELRILEKLMKIKRERRYDEQSST